ncbi:hypothetical protein Q4E40_01145 [Pontibacter sp. BT731]|uniref:hypothetical protein n=1 Tax=Pontibacter coccineus TaxID=3063328 RepID=UPI0026E2961C|nr:hypothetical protein [Pontibacter sp. BT731]MDO6388711.1 hypothetical protein [Pontibacter sp. BT731]
MNTRFLLFLALVWLSACGKDSDGPNMDYPATFQLKRFDQAQPVRMFTRTGEVKDQAFIKSHALTLRMQSLYDLGATEPDDATGTKITFLSGSEAEMDNGRVTRYDVRKEDNALVLTSREERTAGYSRNDEFYMNLLAGISKHKPLIYDKQPLPPALGVGYDYTYKTKEQLAVSLKGQELLLHRLAYAHQRQSSGRSMVINNQFDPTGVSVLREGDTLVVQEFAVIGVPVK